MPNYRLSPPSFVDYYLSYAPVCSGAFILAILLLVYKPNPLIKLTSWYFSPCLRLGTSKWCVSNLRFSLRYYSMRRRERVCLKHSVASINVSSLNNIWELNKDPEAPSRLSESSVCLSRTADIIWFCIMNMHIAMASNPPPTMSHRMATFLQDLLGDIWDGEAFLANRAEKGRVSNRTLQLPHSKCFETILVQVRRHLFQGKEWKRIGPSKNSIWALVGGNRRPLKGIYLRQQKSICIPWGRLIFRNPIMLWEFSSYTLLL